MLAFLNPGISPNNNNPNTDVSAMLPALGEQSKEIIQNLRGMPRDTAFYINSEHEINDANLHNFVTVKNVRGNEKSITITAGKDYFRVNPPAGLYAPGDTYTIQLTNAYFVDERLRGQESVMFTISGEVRRDIVINDDIIEIEKSDVQFFDGYSGDLQVVSGNFSVGDIVFVQSYFYGTYVDAALRVTNVTHLSNGEILLHTETPYMDEAFDQLEIYDSFDVNPQDVHMFSEEEIKQAVLEHESIQAISFAAAVMSAQYESGASAMGISPMSAKKRAVPRSISFSLSGITFSPFQARGSLSVGWRIPIGKTNDFGMAVSNANLHITAGLSFSIQVENYLNVSSDSDRYGSGTITTTSITVSISAYITYNAGQAIINGASARNNFIKRAFERAYAFTKNSLDNVRDNVQRYREDGKAHSERVDGNIRVVEQNNARVANQLRQLDALAREYMNQQQGIGAGIVPLFILPIPVFKGVTIQITAGLVFDIDIQAGLRAEYTVRFTETNGQITTENGTVEYQNSKTTHSFSFQLYGRIEVRIGAGVEIRVTIAKIFFVSATITGGGYIEIGGAIAIHLGNREDNFFGEHANALFGSCPEAGQFTSWLAGHGSIEAGGFIDGNIQVGVRFRVLGIGITIATTIPIFQRRWPVTRGGDDRYLHENLVARNSASPNANVPFNLNYVEESESGNYLLSEVVFNDSNSYRHQLAHIYHRIINLESRMVLYEPVNPRNIRILQSSHTSIDQDGYLFPTRFEDHVISEIIEIGITNNQGTLMEHFDPIFIHVVRNPVPVDSIYLSHTGINNEIRVGQTRVLTTTVMPSNASFIGASFEASIVMPDGRVVSGSAANRYVNIVTGGSLAEVTTTRYIPIGAQINLVAIASEDHQHGVLDRAPVRSNIFTLEVVRTPIYEIHFYAQNSSTSVLMGQVLPFEILFNPELATFIIEGRVAEVTLVDVTLGRIEHVEGNRFRLHVTNDENMLGRVIEIRVLINDNGRIFDEVFELHIRQVHLEGITISNVATGQELGNLTEVRHGDQIGLVPIISPYNATLLAPINLMISGDGRYADIINGILVVNPNAPIGFEFRISATYNNIYSQNYYFRVVRIPVKSVTITTPQTEAVPGDEFLLEGIALPSNATFRNISFEIVSGSGFATVTHNGLVRINNDAPLGAVITIRGFADGVQSNLISVILPLRGIAISSATPTITTGQSIQIEHEFNPAHNVISPIQFFIVSGGEFASITDSGVLTIRNDVSVADARVTVAASVLGVTSNNFTFNIHVPVNNITISSNSENGGTRLGNTVNLVATVNPSFATNPITVFEIVENEQYASLNANRLSINFDATVGARVGVVAIADEVRSAVYFIEILRIPVTFIDFESALEMRIQLGHEYTMSAVALPLHATFRDVSFHIVEGSQYATINGNSIRINENARIGAIIRVRAFADGIYSDYELVITVTRIYVTSVEIATEENIAQVLPGQSVRFNSHLLPLNATTRQVTFFIAGTGSMYAEINPLTGELTIFDNIPRGNVTITIFAVADGVRSNDIIISIFVPISMIVIDSNINGQRVLPGQSFGINHIVNPNATDRNVTFILIYGNQFATLDGNNIRINSNINIGNARLKVQAQAQGVNSNVLEFYIYIAVQNVTISTNNNQVMLDEGLDFSGTVNPGFATYLTHSSLRFAFVDAQGRELALSGLYGVSLQGNRLVVTNVPHAIGQFVRIRGFAGGEASNVITIEIIARPVTEIVVRNPLTIVNPNTIHTNRIEARTNRDATDTRIFFEIDGANASDARIINQSLSNGYFTLTFEVLRNSRTYHDLTIHIIADGMRTTVTLRIVPIYASSITGVVLTYSNREILNGLSNHNSINNTHGVFVNPGATINLSALRLDQSNTTFYSRPNWSIAVVGTSPFVQTVTNNATTNSFRIHALSQFHHLMSPTNNSFTLRITLDQGTRQIYRDINVIIFVPVSSVTVANSTIGTINNNGTVFVDRNSGNNFNSFNVTFRINNGNYSTLRILQVGMTSNFPSGALSTPTFTGQINNATILSVSFRAWYTYGTTFRFNVERDENVQMFAFTVAIRQLNSNQNILFQNYRTSHTPGANQGSVVLGSQTGITAANANTQASAWSSMPRLQRGHSIQPMFGNNVRIAGMTNLTAHRGATVTLTRISAAATGAIDATTGRINIGANATDGHLFIFRATYVDGTQTVIRYFSIQIVQPFTNGWTIDFANAATGRFTNIVNPNLANRFSNNQTRATAIQRFGIVNATVSPFTISGTTATITSTTARHYFMVRVSFVIPYNNTELTTDNNGAIVRNDMRIYRRFITTQANFDNLRNMPRMNEYTFRLLNSITLTGNWTSFVFTGNLDGQNHTITYTQNITPGNGTSNFGLFAALENNDIRNLNITATVNITGSGDTTQNCNVGGLAGRATNSTISNVTVRGTVSGQARGVIQVGGIVGLMQRGTLQNSRNEARIAATTSRSAGTTSRVGTIVAGGLIGTIGQTGQVIMRNNVNTGNVNAHANVDIAGCRINRAAGGLVGRHTANGHALTNTGNSNSGTATATGRNTVNNFLRQSGTIAWVG